MKKFLLATVLCSSVSAALAQTAPDSSQPLPPPQGKVLFERHATDTPAPTAAQEPSAETPAASPARPTDPDPTGPAPTGPAPTGPALTGPALTDTDRAAIHILAYDLDARLTPAKSLLLLRAHVTLRNTGATPLNRIALQISSSLKWESATLFTATAPIKLQLSQHLIETDADHTGNANEALIALPQPLAPGATLSLDTFYDGPIVASAARLENIGATRSQALDSDWDAISATPAALVSTQLRGFGNVLWYPVASPQLFLGDGAALFRGVGKMKLDNESTTIRLHLSVEYQGDPPTAAYFCGRRQPFTALPDNGDMPISIGTGLATADFAAEPLGFRVPSLFVVNQPERLVAPIPTINEIDRKLALPTTSSPATSSPTTPSQPGISSSNTQAEAPTIANSAMLAVASDDEGAIAALAASAETVAPLLQQWLGAEPLSALTVIDHRGQPFEDGPLLVGPAATLAASPAAGALAHSLTHAWLQTGRPWMDEGLAEFFTLLWTEHESGRERAIAQLDDLLQPLALAEPAIAPTTASESGTTSELVGQVTGQPLVAASSELYYRRKAAAVWWMLREIVGDDQLGAALSTWRQRTPVNTTAAEDSLAFESLLEKSGQNATHPIDLHWFFRDWVLHDRGLPDLSITDVTPRELPLRAGHSAGFLVSVSIKNDGAAETEVPVTIRSSTFSTTSQLRILGFSSATARVITETLPTEVLVNDGITPEVRTSLHTLTISGTKNDHQ